MLPRDRDGILDMGKLKNIKSPSRRSFYKEFKVKLREKKVLATHSFQHIH